MAATSVMSVTTDMLSMPDESEAARLRNALVDQLHDKGEGRTPAVEAALRTVPRHVFVPDVPLAEAYANATVSIKDDPDGTSVSCASQPDAVARMLAQLQARPGERVLELGAGTGYNAALLAHLVGPDGHVTTLDVDEDLADGARSRLAAAGVTGVDVATRDGALGHAEGAPFDLIIATVGAHGIPHAWLNQLAPGGRLVTPQRLKGTVARSIAYERRDGRWRSLDSAMNTFMPLRRGIADDARRLVPLTREGTVRLQTPAAERLDEDALADVLAQPRIEERTGMTVRAMESPEWMELFLTCTLPSGLIRMLFPRDARGTLLTEDPYPSSTAAVDGGAVTYLARRPPPAGSHGPRRRQAVGVRRHRPRPRQRATRRTRRRPDPYLGPRIPRPRGCVRDPSLAGAAPRAAARSLRAGHPAQPDRRRLGVTATARKARRPRGAVKREREPASSPPPRNRKDRVHHRPWSA